MGVVYAAVDAAVPMPSGAVQMIRRGEHWLDSDPVVRAHPSLFSDDPTVGVRYSTTEPPSAETATAEPGEVRQVRRRG